MSFAEPLEKIIASGATADIYDIGEGRVFKRFHDDKPDGGIDREYMCTGSAAAQAMGAPKLYGRVNDSRGRGFIMERADGDTMLGHILSAGAAYDIEGNARLLARLHYKLHCLGGDGLPDQREALCYYIRSCGLLDEELKTKLIELCGRLPGGGHACHNDFHPGNVIVTDGGCRVIDWCDADRGSPWPDVARTLILFRCEADIPGADPGAIRGMMRDWERFYREEYERLAGPGGSELEMWLAVVAAARLEREKAADRPWMLALIDRTLGRL